MLKLLRNMHLLMSLFSVDIQVLKSMNVIEECYPRTFKSTLQKIHTVQSNYRACPLQKCDICVGAGWSTIK